MVSSVMPARSCEDLCVWSRAQQQHASSKRLHAFVSARVLDPRRFEMEDLHVNECMPQLIGISESYILMYKRKSAVAKVQAPANMAME